MSAVELSSQPSRLSLSSLAAVSFRPWLVISHACARAPIRIVVLAGAVIILALWVTVALAIIHSRETALRDGASEAMSFAKAFRQQVGFILRNIEGEMKALSAQIAHSGGNFDLYAWGKQDALISSGIANATFVGPDGRLRSTTVETTLAIRDLSDRQYFQVHVDGQYHGLYIGQTVLGRVSGVPLLPISQRISAADGSFLGVLVILVPAEALITIHKVINLGPNSTIALAGLDRRIRARFTAENPKRDLGIDITGTALPEVIDEGAEGSFIRASVVDGITRIFAYVRVGNLPLVVIVGLDQQNALAASRSHAVTIVVLALTATLLLVLTAYLVREIQARARREAELAEERLKLQTTNVALQMTNAELSQSKIRAEQASRAKSQFLANMSHELRTPLNTIIGYSEVIKEQFFGAAAQARYVEYAGDIHSSGQHLLNLINDVLDTARIEAGKLRLNEELVDLCEIIQRSIDRLRLVIERKELHIDSPPGEPVPVLGDPLRLEQVFINLLSNAAKFTPCRGHIAVCIEPHRDGGLTCTISDTGIGMTQEELATAIEPFAQVESDYSKTFEGTGLGLPLAKRLVELHGGSLRIESEKGRGTSVIVKLQATRVSNSLFVETMAAA